MKILSFLLMGTTTAGAVMASVTSGASSSSKNTGFFIGQHLGYGVGDTKVETELIGPTLWNKGKSGSDISASGITGGVHFGYDQLMRHSFILGAEISINTSNIKGSTTNKNDLQLETPFEKRTDLQLSQSYDVAIRLGYLTPGKTLIYLKAGPTWGKWKTKTVIATVNGSSNAIKKGMMAGTGVRFPLASQLGMSLDVTYRIYKKINYNVDDGTTVKMSTTPRSIDFTIGLSYII
jgi:outer membrane immunogenic protein